MRAFSVLGAVASASPFRGQVQCDRHVEILLLQDATASYATIGDEMGSKFSDLVKSIDDRMGEAYTSVALFCDKPTPFRGAGEGRGISGVVDMCYNNDFTLPLASDSSALVNAYDQIYDLECLGGDFPESSLEALMYAAMDPKVNWSDANKVYTADMKRIVKVVVLVTDDHPHYAGDAAAGIASWNPLETGTTDSYPHFFDAGFYSLGGFYSLEGNEEKYNRLVELHKLETMTADESVEYDQLVAWLGPAVWDTPIEHPGTFEAYKNCKIYEYPTLKLVGEVLNRENVLPVVLLASGGVSGTSKALCEKRGFKADDKESFLKCLTAIYTSDLTAAGIKNFVVTSYSDSDDLVAKIVDKVDELSRDVTCPESTTPAPETDTTTGGESTTAESTAEASTASTEASSASSDKTSDSTSASSATDSAETVTTDSAETGSDSTTEEHTTGFIAPVVPGKSSNTAVIAGASGGAVAGAAAIGGLLYKKFGASLLGHNTPGDLNVGEQVETPDTPVEREAFEEVTTDMFQ